MRGGHWRAAGSRVSPTSPSGPAAAGCSAALFSPPQVAQRVGHRQQRNGRPLERRRSAPRAPASRTSDGARRHLGEQPVLPIPASPPTMTTTGAPGARRTTAARAPRARLLVRRTSGSNAPRHCDEYLATGHAAAKDRAVGYGALPMCGDRGGPSVDKASIPTRRRPRRVLHRNRDRGNRARHHHRAGSRDAGGQRPQDHRDASRPEAATPSSRPTPAPPRSSTS